MKRISFVTGSQQGDLAIFLTLACMIILASYRLAVYYQVTVLKVSIVQISPDGTRRLLPTPGEFQRIWSPDEPSGVISRLEEKIGEYMHHPSVKLNAGPGTRFEWVIRYSHNSMRLDQERRVEFNY